MVCGGGMIVVTNYGMADNAFHVITMTCINWSKRQRRPNGGSTTPCN